jgi:hypothetical protein
LLAMRCQVAVLVWAMGVEVQEVHLLVTFSVGHRLADRMKREVCLWLQTQINAAAGPESCRRGLEEELFHWAGCETR